ncbi:NAD-dependent epimerase/dehydratase family protein [Snuella sedimenti]|uniref:NAD-dependent epimerase/dehydratase family protein n=1 Tax=Snuella sedimenti TaxID=2798802 RepID=A0A8J7ITT4_9FLAO|nr:NAD-dependent epimerase/dehydratase family protein [Snuella sedimenti]MBJ6367880.1 NAD-dependent epimerase/dehydratase family protein [Snuella sedimenti]
MKILVTGAAGFIGSHTAERLSKMGHEVVGVDNFSPYYDVKLKRSNENVLKDSGIYIINKDLRDSDLREHLPKDVNYIYHFAAHPGISSHSSFHDYLSNNILGTKNLVDYALQLPDLKLFVNIGTSSVYGLEATCSEISEPKPASYYGVTKLAAEQLVLQKSREQKLNACSLRLYSVIGPRERPEKLYTKLIASGIKKETFPLFEGSQNHIRSFTYVGDIVDGVVGVIGKEALVNTQVINLGTEAEHTTKQGIEAVEAVLGTSITIKTLPKRTGDQLRTKANIDKAKALLNYNPQTTLAEAVKQQVAWYKHHIL